MRSDAHIWKSVSPLFWGFDRDNVMLTSHIDLYAYINLAYQNFPISMAWSLRKSRNKKRPMYGNSNAICTVTHLQKVQLVHCSYRTLGQFLFSKLLHILGTQKGETLQMFFKYELILVCKVGALAVYREAHNKHHIILSCMSDFNRKKWVTVQLPQGEYI